MMGRKKVLMIAHAFPPRHGIGSLRAAKFAKYLPRFGWEPVVLTRHWEGERGLEEPPGVEVIRTPYQDKLRFFRRGSSTRAMPASRGQQTISQSLFNSVWRIASFWLKECLAYPDEFSGWKPYALEAGRERLRAGDISLIFSTSPPPTSHLIASELQRETGLPWVADFRDLWTQNHYVRHTLLRRWIERRLEKKALARATVLITVSQPLAGKLQRLHGKPVEVITNGFDEDDYSSLPPSPTPYFSLTYTGQIYAGKRDPTLLFSAVRYLLDTGLIDPKRFKIRFYGPERDRGLVVCLADRFGIRELVSHGGYVPYQEAILRQRESTALLLLNWNSPEEKGVYTGKVFEYLGAKRPILAIPGNNGVVDELLYETASGVVASTKEEIATILKSWYDEFVKTGGIAYKGKDEIIKQYTRATQAGKLAAIFDRVIS